MSIIDTLNHREDIDGILCQLPLPAGYDEQQVLLAIDPDKDVDGFHPVNVGRLPQGRSAFTLHAGGCDGDAQGMRHRS